MMTIEQLRHRVGYTERTFNRALSRDKHTAEAWADWNRETNPAKKAEHYERLRAVGLAQYRLGPIVLHYEWALEDLQAAERAAEKTGT